MEHSLNIKFKARYFSQGDPNASTLVIALHGYGQLASYFLKKFEALPSEKYFVVAPEGLNRFYLNDTSGRVGASWMTKESRETDIANYIHYLNELLITLTQTKTYEKVVLLGFSQGAATASRFLENALNKIDVFILWAAVFPPDMAPAFNEKLKQTQNFLVIGDQDPYYSVKDIVLEHEKLNQSGMKFELKTFSGAHTVNSITLTTILNAI